MKAIIALEQMIKDNEMVVKSIKKQLSKHESGESKLSYMGIASAETNLETAQKQLERHREKLKELMSQDMTELAEKEKVKEAITRKNFLQYQKTRIKRDVIRTNDEKLEAMLVLDELKEDQVIDDDLLFEIASEIVSLHLTSHTELQKQLKEIQKDFDGLIKNIDGENIKDMLSYNVQIPLVILHLRILIENIKENIEDENLPAFRGLPKFEDWWIKELWSNHQAYYGLYKWKSIIRNFCISSDQKSAWEVIFTNWLSIKKAISAKGELGYQYNYAFDTVMRNHTELEEELATNSLISMENLMETLAAKDNFAKSPETHTLITGYVLFKREKIDYKDVKPLPKN